MKPPPHIQNRLRRIGMLTGEHIRLGETALFLATAVDKRARIMPYIRHLKHLTSDVTSYLGRDLETADITLRAEALRQVLAKRYGYGPVPEDGADIREAANFMRLIDTRAGTGAALAVLYVHVAQTLGWDVSAVNFPGRSLVRLEAGGIRGIFDPSDGFLLRAPQDLRRLLKEIVGEQAELAPGHYAKLDNRALLIRFQDRLKLYLLETERYFEAADIIDTTLLFAPLDAALWREAGHLHARLDNITAAVSALENFMRLSEGSEKRYRTSLLLQELRARLH
ncbi:MAG: tetratricopeptide repeat protein [Rhodospirillales bacterium]